MEKLNDVRIGINGENLNFDSGGSLLYLLRKLNISLTKIEDDFSKGEQRLYSKLEEVYKLVKSKFNLDKLTENILPYFLELENATEPFNNSLTEFHKTGIDKQLDMVADIWSIVFKTLTSVHMVILFLFGIFFIYVLQNISRHCWQKHETKEDDQEKEMTTFNAPVSGVGSCDVFDDLNEIDQNTDNDNETVDYLNDLDHQYLHRSDRPLAKPNPYDVPINIPYSSGSSTNPYDSPSPPTSFKFSRLQSCHSTMEPPTDQPQLPWQQQPPPARPDTPDSFLNRWQIRRSSYRRALSKNFRRSIDFLQRRARRAGYNYNASVENHVPVQPSSDPIGARLAPIASVSTYVSSSVISTNSSSIGKESLAKSKLLPSTSCCPSCSQCAVGLLTTLNFLVSIFLIAACAFCVANFFVSGLLHTEVCRYVHTPRGVEMTDQSIDLLINKTFDSMIEDALVNVTVDLSLTSPTGVLSAIYKGCAPQNATLLPLLGLQDLINVTAMISSPLFKDILNSGKSIASKRILQLRIDEIIPKAMDNALEEAKKITKQFVDSNDYETSLRELQNPLIVLNQDFKVYLEELLNISKLVLLRNPNEGKAKLLNFQVKQFMKREMDNYFQLKNELVILKMHFDTLQNTRTLTAKIGKLKKDLDKSKLNLRNHKTMVATLNAVYDQVIQSTMVSIGKALRKHLRNLERSLAPCTLLSRAYNTVLDGVCTQTLSRFAAYSLIYSVSVTLLQICLISAAVVAWTFRSYRSREDATDC